MLMQVFRKGKRSYLRSSAFICGLEAGPWAHSAPSGCSLSSSIGAKGNHMPIDERS